MLKGEFYTNTINKRCNKIDGQDKLKGVLFTRMIRETNEIIDNTNLKKDKILKDIEEIQVVEKSKNY